MLPVVHVKVDDQQQKRFTPSPFLHPDIDSVVQNVRRSAHKSSEDSSGRKSLSISLVNRSSFPSDTDSTTCRASHTSLNDELGNDGRVLSSNHDDDDDSGRRSTFNELLPLSQLRKRGRPFKAQVGGGRKTDKNDEPSLSQKRQLGGSHLNVVSKKQKIKSENDPNVVNLKKEVDQLKSELKNSEIASEKIQTALKRELMIMKSLKTKTENEKKTLESENLKLKSLSDKEVSTTKERLESMSNLLNLKNVQISQMKISEERISLENKKLAKLLESSNAELQKSKEKCEEYFQQSIVEDQRLVTENENLNKLVKSTSAEFERTKVEHKNVLNLLNLKRSEIFARQLTEERLTMENQKLMKLIEEKKIELEKYNSAAQQMQDEVKELKQVKAENEMFATNVESVKTNLKHALRKDDNICKNLTGGTTSSIDGLKNDEIFDIVNFVVRDYVDSKRRHLKDVEIGNQHIHEIFLQKQKYKTSVGDLVKKLNCQNVVIKDLMKKTRELEAETEDLKRENEIKHEKISELAGKSSIKAQMILESNEKLKNKKIELKDLKEKLEVKDDQINVMQETLNKVKELECQRQQEITTLTSEMNRKNLESEEVSKSLIAKDKYISDLKFDVQCLTEKHNQMIDEIQSLTGNQKQNITDIQSKAEEITTLKSEIVKLKEEMTDNAKKETDHISRLESNLAVIKSRANSRLEKASDLINQLTERSEKYSNKISELQDTLQKQSETIVNLDLRLEGETDTVKKLKSEIERQEDEHHQEIQKFISSVNQVKSQFCFLIKGFINIISIIVCYLAPSISI